MVRLREYSGVLSDWRYLFPCRLVSYTDSICYYDFWWYKCANYPAFGVELLFWNGTISSENTKAGSFYFLILFMCLLGEKLCSIYAERIAVTFGVDCTCSFSFQEKVACLADNDARLALDPNDKYKIQVENFHTRINNIVFKTYIAILLLRLLSLSTFLTLSFVTWQTKPHGHGDVHSLLYSSGLLEQWYAYWFKNWLLGALFFLLEEICS